MRIFKVIFLTFALNLQNAFQLGTSVDTSGMSNANSGLTSTTVKSLDDISEVQSFVSSDDQGISTTSGLAVLTNKLQGVSTKGDAQQDGKGITKSDSQNKTFTPTKQFKDKNYKMYLEFLKYFEEQKEKENEKIDSILSLIKSNSEYKGEENFDHHKSFSSGYNTRASSKSENFSYGGSLYQKGSSDSIAEKGFVETENFDWNLNKNKFGKKYKISTAFGDNSYARSSNDKVFRNGIVESDGETWSQAFGKDSKAFSRANGENFGQGGLEGISDTYSNGQQSFSKSKLIEKQSNNKQQF